MNTHLLISSPVGRLAPIEGGASAFVPAPLPRDLNLDGRTIFLLDNASRSVATLAGVGETLLNPNLLLQPFLRREAVFSSRIEGTQTMLADLVFYEASDTASDARGDAGEVLNYVTALEHGLARLNTLPISIRFLNELHEKLMTGARGDDREPGKIRSRQVFIGRPGSIIQEARFIPPPAGEIPPLLHDWEQFANSVDLELPPLIQAALLHYQFEAIHPYVDGNGRIGRLMIALFLAARQVLPIPLLYLSGYFERHKDEYMDHLLQVSIGGDWLPWLQFFLSGVADQANDALLRSRSVRNLHAEYQARLQARDESANAFRVVDHLFTRPVTTPAQTAALLSITRAGARVLLDRLVNTGVLSVVASTRPRYYVARELMDVIQAPLAT